MSTFDPITILSEIMEDRKQRAEFIKNFQEDSNHIKMKLLYRFTNRQIGDLMKYYSIPEPEPYEFTHEFEKKVQIMLTRNHYLKNAAEKLAFEQIVTFAQNNHIKTQDLKIERESLLKIYLMNIGKIPRPTEKPVKWPPPISTID